MVMVSRVGKTTKCAANKPQQPPQKMEMAKKKARAPQVDNDMAQKKVNTQKVEMQAKETQMKQAAVEKAPPPRARKAPVEAAPPKAEKKEAGKPEEAKADEAGKADEAKEGGEKKGFLDGIFEKLGPVLKEILQNVIKSIADMLGLGGVFEKKQDLWNNPSLQNAGELAVEGGKAALPFLEKILPGVGDIGGKLLEFAGKIVGALPDDKNDLVGGAVDGFKGIPGLGQLADLILGKKAEGGGGEEAAA
ncbi:hypothetical protein [Veronia pacifica]|uniref:Uncharacterized protein n=1 Tax=Veronia pacifica TaxID=1080227 RepID=A0A1C3EMR8_9GAMM|nr:hypothetical protein [Veronia pacifica]ODA34537.1 hypothetical protein A8L45_06090 [Veronia pacifica]